jgi:hypothetical protein
VHSLKNELLNGKKNRHVDYIFRRFLQLRAAGTAGIIKDVLVPKRFKIIDVI